MLNHIIYICTKNPHYLLTSCKNFNYGMALLRARVANGLYRMINIGSKTHMELVENLKKANIIKSERVYQTMLSTGTA